MALRGEYTYDYPRPLVCVDVALFTAMEGRLNILLIERRHDPYGGRWALPGGFLELNETLEDAAARELAEETGIRGIMLEQLHAFGRVDRDPRGRNIAIAYVGVVDWRNHAIEGGDDAVSAVWFPVESPPSLAFDHDDILAMAVRKLHAEAHMLSRLLRLGYIPVAHR